MEKLPAEISFKIFCLLDHQNLAKAQQGLADENRIRKTRKTWICRKWKDLASDNILWCNLFRERWGGGHAAFFAPLHTKSWKDVYEVQDRCDRVGLGLKIIREANEYYLVHQGVIQRCLGSRNGVKGMNGHCSVKRGLSGEGSLEVEEPCLGILDKILFFIGDLEVAARDAKRSRIL